MSKKITNDSILGNMTSFENKEEGKFIIHRPDENILEVCPRAFSRPDSTGTNRQDYYRRIYQTVQKMELEDAFFPFGIKDTEITLVPEPTNPVDKYAIKVILNTNSKSLLKDLNGVDLGYIPQDISYPLNKNLKRVDKVLIKNVYRNTHSKYFTCKIAISYDGNSFINDNSSRFEGLLDED